MTLLRAKIASVFLCLQFLIATFAVAQVADNQIRVLAVSTNGVSSADVILQMNFLEFFGPAASGVEIQLANGGVPVPLGVTLTGSDFDRLNQAKANPTWQSYRSTWGADVMILFSTNMEGCGLAPQYNWASVQDPIPGEFIGDPLNFNLDLRGASNGYAAIVEVGGSGCPPMMTAAHEMGHLLGSGHTHSVSEDLYLTNTSHAAAFVSETAPGVFQGFKTLGAQRSNPPECGDEGFICQQMSVFSNGIFPSFPPSVPKANALATFQTTALSVANYYVGSGGGSHGGGGGGGPLPQCDDGIDNDGDGHTDYPNDPDCASLGDDDESDTGGGGGGGGCGLQVPANLIATLVAVCSPPGWTQYTLTWIDFCPSASSSYEIHKEIPVGSGFVFGWESFVPSSPAFINSTSPGLVKVRACNFSSCSAFSNTAVLVDSC